MILRIVSVLILVGAAFSQTQQPQWLPGVITVVSENRDVTVRTADKEFVLNPDLVFSQKKGVRVLQKTTNWGWGVKIPVMNAGDKVELQLWGNRAWLRLGGRQYQCSVVRQALLAPA